MKRLAFTTAVCLLSGAAYGDFELKDPALMEEKELNTPVAKRFITIPSRALALRVVEVTRLTEKRTAQCITLI